LKTNNDDDFTFFDATTTDFNRTTTDFNNGAIKVNFTFTPI